MHGGQESYRLLALRAVPAPPWGLQQSLATLQAHRHCLYRTLLLAQACHHRLGQGYVSCWSPLCAVLVLQ